MHPKALLRREGNCPANSHHVRFGTRLRSITAGCSRTLTISLSPGTEIVTSGCCDNTQHCITNETTLLEPQCCPLGWRCGSSCHQDSFHSVVTTTTIMSTASTALSVVEAAGTYVQRVCTRNNYLGHKAFGNLCCQIGSDCALQVNVDGAIGERSDANSSSHRHLAHINA